MNFKIMVLVGSIAAFGSIPAAYAQFGGLMGMSGMSGTSNSAPADVDGFIKNSKAADELVKKSLDKMSATLANKEEAAKIEALKVQAAAATDPKEKDAIEQKAVKAQAAALNSIDFDKAANEDIKKMDDKQKKNLASSIYNFLIAQLKNKELVTTASNLVKQIGSNPMLIAKLSAVKDASSSISSQLEVTGQLVTKVPKLFKAVGIRNPPTKASDVPQEIAD